MKSVLPNEALPLADALIFAYLGQRHRLAADLAS